VMGQFDQQTDLSRREVHISSLAKKQSDLETFRRQGQSAVQDIQSILDKMGSNLANVPSHTPSRNASPTYQRVNRNFAGNNKFYGKGIPKK